MRWTIHISPWPRRPATLVLVLALVGCDGVNAPLVDSAVASGELNVPANYRSTFEPAGVWAVAADTGSGSKEMHIVYASPGALDAYRRTRDFPDGSVLVKEVVTATTASMTTGTVSQPAILKGWFVMVRDSQNSHPGDKRWGDGWGWSWFDASNPKQSVTADYQTECLGCHEPARATKLTYTHGFPFWNDDAATTSERR